MGHFIHNPNGIIQINNKFYSLEWFLKQEPNYSLPKNALGRIYYQNKYHMINILGGDYHGEMPWEDGNEYISKSSVYEEEYSKIDYMRIFEGDLDEVKEKSKKYVNSIIKSKMNKKFESFDFIQLFVTIMKMDEAKKYQEDINNKKTLSENDFPFLLCEKGIKLKTLEEISAKILNDSKNFRKEIGNIENIRLFSRRNIDNAESIENVKIIVDHLMMI